ncbi:thiamine-binding protein [Malacoplasma iowae]|uniref:DUF77 superfamily protein n=1 Tax=Malacoplasma iowae DK-CPA TaxID=1394179 RepID=A0A084U494_MALIO|nr:thiamine-binding protein [Malacoplasma iowae]KFB07780.1 DUF77 superfamily protein [Malacoplasma iowae DK-CPA]WPL37175.1 thiamine-binding protein [Malacoplasma iowae]WPL37707.1 thiamine-binding protein [Malacoplasma iowae]WPL40729.1 thiamine-binding protein [Malacoplasma iowae]
MKNTTLSLKILRINHDKDIVFKMVDDVIDIIKNSNLNYLVGPSETTIDGNIDELMNLLSSIMNFVKESSDPVFISSQFYYQKRGITPLEEKIKNK